MWPRLIVFLDPGIQIDLQLVNRTIHLLPECDTVESVEHGLVEALTDAVGLRALGLGARVIDVLNREIELVLVSFGIAAELTPAIGQDAEKLDVVVLEYRQHSIIEQIGRRDRRLAIVKLGAGDLGVGVDEGLLIDAPDPLWRPSCKP